MKEVVTPLHGGSVRSGQARAAQYAKKSPPRRPPPPGGAPRAPPNTAGVLSARHRGGAKLARVPRGVLVRTPPAHRAVYLGILPIAAGRRRAAWPSATRVGTELRQGRVVGGRRGSASAVGATTEAL